MLPTKGIRFKSIHEPDLPTSTRTARAGRENWQRMNGTKSHRHRANFDLWRAIRETRQ